MKKQKLNWRINHQIHAPRMRVIDEKGKQVGILTKEKALSLAQEAGLDLIEIAPNASPPVVKIIELGKFKYKQEKKDKTEKKKTKTSYLKEVRLTPFIASHDFANRLEKIKKFLSERHKVRIVVRFRQRQIESKQFGYNHLNTIMEEVKDNAIVDMSPKFIGRNLIMVISPTNKRVNSAADQEKKVKIK